MTYHRVCNKSNTTGAYCGARTYPFGAPEFATVFKLVLVRFVLFLLSNYMSSSRFLFRMMFVSFDSNTTDVTCGAGTANPSGVPEFIPGVKWGSCCSICSFLCNVLQIVVCPFVLFSFSHCIVLSVDLRLLIAPFVSSNYS